MSDIWEYIDGCMEKKDELCHCGEPIFHPVRGVCEYCTMMGCDIFTGACDE